MRVNAGISPHCVRRRNLIQAVDSPLGSGGPGGSLQVVVVLMEI
jgi:hypothetical protein